MTINSWTGTSSDLAGSYAEHSGSLRGALRHALVSRGLLEHLPKAPQRVLDVGGGAGHQAIALARAGHNVVVLDLDPAMLARAAAAVAGESAEVQDRVSLVEGAGEDAAHLTGTGFDAVMCHGVLMYLDDPAALLASLAEVTKPGGLISVLTKNKEALAMRPALEGSWSRALSVIDADSETGNLGATSRAHRLADIERDLAAAGAATVAWYGVRVFTDHLGDTPVGADFDQILAAEWAAGIRDPYRGIARLFHLIARRDEA